MNNLLEAAKTIVPENIAEMQATIPQGAVVTLDIPLDDLVRLSEAVRAEPVAWMYTHFANPKDQFVPTFEREAKLSPGWTETPLYAGKPTRQEEF